MIRRLASLIFCTFIATWQYVVVGIANCQGCNFEMERILTGTAQAPHAYRVLTPVILSLMGNTVYALVIFHMLLFAVFFTLLWIWSKRWQVQPVGVLMTATVFMVVMMPTYYYSAWTVLEYVLWLGVLLLLPRFSHSAR